MNEYELYDAYTSFMNVCNGITVREFRHLVLLREMFCEEKAKKNPDWRLIQNIVHLGNEILKGRRNG
jgi:hypothetical protein